MSGKSEEVDARYREALRKLDPAERLAMACRMFSAARSLVVASLPSRERDPEGLRLIICFR